MIIIVDHHDSFTHNLARYIKLATNTEVIIISEDKVDLPQLLRQPPQALVLSPGPGHPSQAQIAETLIQHWHGRIPLLGICLGHQTISACFGGTIHTCKQILHGKTSPVHHNHHPIFNGLENPFTVARYHSLCLDSHNLPKDFEVIAHSEDDCVMAIAHQQHPTVGIQFHPEAYLTEHGHRIIENFFGWATCLSPDCGHLTWPNKARRQLG